METIVVYIDNNVWDFLFERNIDISIELPKEHFCLCMTREAEFEIPPIPDKKIKLKRFIKETIAKCVETRPYFGFYDPKHGPNEQRVGGWDVGYWASNDELDFINQQKTKLGDIKSIKTGLYKNEADISLAARSIISVVITQDEIGPINSAYKQGGNVIYLKEFDKSGLSLADFIRKTIDKT